MLATIFLFLLNAIYLNFIKNKIVENKSSLHYYENSYIPRITETFNL